MKTTKSQVNGIPRPDYNELDYDQPVERVDYDFGLSRRSFVKVLGAGLLVTVSLPALAQESGWRGRGGFFGSGAKTIGARIHLGTNGIITVLSGKAEGGQGARAELSQAAAEELRVPVGQIQMLLADTAAVPDDGMIDWPDLPPAGAGETPIIAIAPAIANAVFRATGKSVQAMPVRLGET
jgi:CO/xanthine dehydrogenase Mo-binding subunit